MSMPFWQTMTIQRPAASRPYILRGVYDLKHTEGFDTLLKEAKALLDEFASYRSSKLP